MTRPSLHPGAIRRRSSFAAIVVVLLSMAGADLFVYASGRRGILASPEGTPPVWIVVPGASVRRDGTPSPVLRERMLKALEATRAWPHARLLLSGTFIPGGYSEPDAMRSWMLSHKVNSDRIVLDRSGTDTRSTIRHLGPPSGSVVLVSQSWHLPRALWSARAAGWDARGLAAKQTGWGLRLRLREHVVRILYFFSPT